MKGNSWMGKFRPQIFLAIVVLGVLAYFGASGGYPEIATGTKGTPVFIAKNEAPC